MQNNYGGFQNRGNNSNMNSNNTMFISSNFSNNQNGPNMNQNNNNFNFQNNNSNMNLAQSQAFPNSSNKKKLHVQLTQEEQNLYPKLYNMLDDRNSGRILGKPAANFMKKSNLDKNVLKQIWLTAAQTSNTFIEQEEFFVALRLIALAQNNMPFSPQNIEMNNPIPPLPNFNLNNNQNNNNNNNFNNNQNNNNNFNNNQNSLYEISEKEKAFFKNIFDNKKEPNGERITAHNAIIIWKSNNADDQAIKIVANIIKPLETKGFLNLKEFQVACHLITISKKNPLPHKLPDNLVNYLGRNNNNNFQNNMNSNMNNFNNNNDFGNSRMGPNSRNTNMTQFFNTNNDLNNSEFTIQNKQLSNNNTCFHKFSNDNTCYNNKNSSVDTNEQNKTKNKNTTNNICNKKNNNSEKKDNNNTNTNNHLYNNYNKGEKTNTGTGKGEKEVLNLDNIISGKDNRTTVMIRNIPIKYSDEQLIEALEEFKGKYNCLYMPYDFEKNGNKGYAFINFVNPLHILYFYEKFNGKKWTYYESSKICELNVAHFQGINEIKKPTFYIGDNYQKEINNNMIIPMKYLQKLKKRFPKMDYTENKNKKIFIVKSFSNN